MDLQDRDASAILEFPPNGKLKRALSTDSQDASLPSERFDEGSTDTEIIHVLEFPRNCKYKHVEGVGMVPYDDFYGMCVVLRYQPRCMLPGCLSPARLGGWNDVCIGWQDHCCKLHKTADVTRRAMFTMSWKTEFAGFTQVIVPVVSAFTIKKRHASSAWYQPTCKLPGCTSFTPLLSDGLSTRWKMWNDFCSEEHKREAQDVFREHKEKSRAYERWLKEKFQDARRKLALWNIPRRPSLPESSQASTAFLDSETKGDGFKIIYILEFRLNYQVKDADYEDFAGMAIMLDYQPSCMLPACSAPARLAEFDFDAGARWGTHCCKLHEIFDVPRQGTAPFGREPHIAALHERPTLAVVAVKSRGSAHHRPRPRCKYPGCSAHALPESDSYGGPVGAPNEARAVDRKTWSDYCGEDHKGDAEKIINDDWERKHKERVEKAECVSRDGGRWRLWDIGVGSSSPSSSV